MSDETAVAVVVPTYRRPARLREALESVRRQTYDPVETVVVDGDPDRGAAPVVDEFERAEYVHQPDPPAGVTGPADARDRGVAATDAPLVRFLDDDDRLHPAALERQVATMREGVGVVYCGYVWDDGREALPDPAVRGDVLEHALKLQVGPCVPSAMLVRRPLLEAVGPMRALPHDDAALVVELARRTRFDFVDDTLVDRGAPERSLTRSRSSLEGRKRTIEAYDRLYERFHPRVRGAAVARVSFQEGEFLVRERGWSPAAVRAFARAAWHAPGLQPVYVGGLVASLFGSPGWALAVRCYHAASGQQRRGDAGRIA